MIRLLIIVSLLLSGCTSLTKAPVSDLTITHVQDVAGQSKKEIYGKTLSWLAETFVDSKSVIEYSNESEGRVIGKGLTHFYSSGIARIPVRFTLIIDIKDQKIRAQYTNWTGMWGEYQNQPAPVTLVGNVEQVRTNLFALNEKLMAYVSQSKSDW